MRLNEIKCYLNYMPDKSGVNKYCVKCKSQCFCDSQTKENYTLVSLLYQSCRMVFLHLFHFSVNNKMHKIKMYFISSLDIPLQSLKNIRDAISTVLLTLYWNVYDHFAFWHLYCLS